MTDYAWIIFGVRVMRGNSKNKGGRGGHMKVGAWWGPERKARVTITLNNSEHFHLKYWFLKFMIKIKKL